MSSWKTRQLKNLATILVSIKDKERMLNFLRDIATLEELDALSSRWEAVTLIADGVSYRDVAKRTGLSTATVTRVAHWLHHGEGGYRQALAVIKKKK